MEKKILFPQIGGIMHGGDYNPEQWLDRPDILEEDIRMMKKAGMNCATLGVFSWSTYEPREGEFHFAWLHDFITSATSLASFCSVSISFPLILTERPLPK